MRHPSHRPPVAGSVGAHAMAALAVTLAAALLLAGCAPGEPPRVETGDITPVEVTRVTDGDTVHVRMPDGTDEKVRVIGIDAPEDTERHDPYGREATAFAERELAGRAVWLETDAELRDRYGRLLAYVWLSEPPPEPTVRDVRESMFEARMLAEGYASLLTVPPNVRYANVLAPLQDEARREDRGLWGLPTD